MHLSCSRYQYGTAHPVLIGLAVTFLAVSGAVRKRLPKHLGLPILTGIPEPAPEQYRSALVT